MFSYKTKNDMETITEDYCLKEIYRLLIEKGFDGEVHTTFDEEGYTQPSITLQMAMKWLREKHNIVVEPFIREDTKYVWYIHRIETRFNKKYLVFCWGSKNNKYERYEQACEAAIKYCLENLI